VTSHLVSLDNAVSHVKKVLYRNPAKQVSSAVENMLKTGRLATRTGLDLQQVLTFW
jgi:DNA-directed RNA polymerase I subunit RPA2